MKFADFTAADLATFKPWAKVGHEASTGHLTVAVEPDGEYVNRFNFLIEFTDEEIEQLRQTKRAWVGQCGAVLQPVFCGGVVTPARSLSDRTGRAG